MKKLVIYIVLFSQYSLYCQFDSLKLDKIDAYRDWNWQAYVIDNGLITSAIVPSMGATMLQYDLGVDTFLITNPATYGHTYTPGQIQSPFNGIWGFGGFEVWSTPETWPPSPALTYCQYEDSLIFQRDDSLQIMFASQTEITGFPGIQYVKLYTAYKNSTCIKFQHALINKGLNPVHIGTMNVAEILTQHAGLEDFSNFRAYFPIKKSSIFGNQCVKISPVSTAFQGEVAPGIFGVEYINVRGKVFADSPEGWMAFVDDRDTQTYVCMYDIYDGAEYPDQGANTEVYVDNSLAFLALEAISPLVTVNPVSDTLKFTEFFASTRLNGVIKKVNQSGAVAERLTYDSINQKLTGRFGVFNKSTIKILYCDTLGTIIEEGSEYQASPDTTFILSEHVILPEGTQLIKLRAFNIDGTITGDLDEEDFIEDEFVSSFTDLKSLNSSVFSHVKVFVNGHSTIQVQFFSEEDSKIGIELISIDGSIISKLYEGVISAGKYNNEFSTERIQKGIYFLRLNSNKGMSCEKLLIQ